MAHIFYEFPSLKPGVPDVETLMEVIKSSELTRFVIGAEVVDFVKKALIVNTTIGSFKIAISPSATGHTSRNLTARENQNVSMKYPTGSSLRLNFLVPSGLSTTILRM